MRRHIHPVDPDFVPEHPESWDPEFDLGVFDGEFRAWRRQVCETARVAGLPVPAMVLPSLPGGLPEGWVVRAQRGDESSDQFLVERVEGGWCVVEHDVLTGRASTYVLTVGVTVADVYVNVSGPRDDPARFRSVSPGVSGNDEQWPVAVMVGSYIAGRFYDEVVPVEAAEQMLVLLGAPLRLMPEGASRRPE